jgi:hypothetical protein
MSNYTNSNCEVLSASIANGTQLATFTTEASLMGGILVPKIPAGYFLNNTSVGRVLHFRAYGRMGSTTTGPIFTVTPRLFAHGTAFSAGGGLPLGVFATVQMAASQTLAPWQMDLDMWMDNENEDSGATGTSQFSTYGLINAPKGFVSPFMATLPDNNVSTNVITNFSPWQTYDLHIGVACNTSNAANLIRMDRYKFYGENLAAPSNRLEGLWPSPSALSAAASLPATRLARLRGRTPAGRRTLTCSSTSPAPPAPQTR